jgi:hypothetical protein
VTCTSVSRRASTCRRCSVERRSRRCCNEGLGGIAAPLCQWGQITHFCPGWGCQRHLLSAIGMHRKNSRRVLAALRLLSNASSCWRHAPTPTANIIHNSDPGHGRPHRAGRRRIRGASPEEASRRAWPQRRGRAPFHPHGSAVAPTPPQAGRAAGLHAGWGA